MRVFKRPPMAAVRRGTNYRKAVEHPQNKKVLSKGGYLVGDTAARRFMCATVSKSGGIGIVKSMFFIINQIDTTF